MTQDLIAFWGYDTFPFVLWGEVERFRADGYVSIKNYGCAFKPLYILPAKEGMELIDKLAKLRESYNDAISTVKSDYKKKLDTTLPFKYR